MLVLGSDTRSFLSVVRSLGRYGLTVDAAWSTPGSIALRSRYLRQVHRLPTPWQQPQDWLDAFAALTQSEQYDLIVPCNDPSLIPLQQHRQALPDVDKIYLLDDTAFATTQSKICSAALAESLDIPLPTHRPLTSVEEGLEFAGDVGYPLILKPGASYSPGSLRRKQTVQTVTDRQALVSRLEPMLRDGRVQAQAFFHGVGTGVEVLAERGAIRFAFQHLRLHEPFKGGGSSYRCSVPLHPGMLAATKQLIAALDYSGVAMVEFRWNRTTDEWIFVEINGRFWGSLPLALACGADFPRFLYQSRVERRQQFPQDYRVGVCCRNWERDKNWLSEQASQSSNLLRFSRQFAAESAIGLWRGVTLREHSDTFSWDDPRPGLAELGAMVQGVWDGGRGRLRRRLAKTPQIQNRHRRRAIASLRTATRILFVCKGNICRSPLAEAYVRAKLPAKMQVDSSGYYPRAGRGSPSPAIQAAKRLELDLETHRSQIVDEQRMRRADIVFVFDDENYCELKARFPAHRHKLFLLGAFADGDVYIQDPYGSCADEFDRVFCRIQTALDELLGEL